MVTREQIETALSDEKDSLKTKIDHDVTAISLLRERIPYEAVRGIIQGADHDVIWLVDVEDALPYLNEQDLAILAECNCWIDENHDCIGLFV